MTLTESPSQTVEWYTPQEAIDFVEAIYGKGGIDLDPCADMRKRIPAKRHYTREDDGLSLPWTDAPPASSSTRRSAAAGKPPAKTADNGGGKFPLCWVFHPAHGFAANQFALAALDANMRVTRVLT